MKAHSRASKRQAARESVCGGSKSRTDAIAFDHELGRGLDSYKEKLGHWWRHQAANRAHSYAYRNIADFIQASFREPPRTLLDYACGGGHLLARIRERFPETRLIGIDGSPLLLGMARHRLIRRPSGSAEIELIETALPDFRLQPQADVVVFAFPNIVPITADAAPDIRQFSPNDLEIGRHLAQAGEDIDSTGNAGTVHMTLLCDRLVSLNIYRLLRPGGICIRIEYGNVRREQLPELELIRTEFEEGSLGHAVDGKHADQWFRVVASCYYRSAVMEDVYQQSGDEGDRRGGYFITVLRALPKRGA